MGDLCEFHAVNLLGLVVKPSSLENAGLGLFTTRPRRCGEYICAYGGRLIASAEFERAPDMYGVQVDGGRVLSARYSTDGFARFANDARSAPGNNCQLMTEATFFREHGSAAARRARAEGVCLVAKGHIEAGSELFVSYGREYWMRHHAWQGRESL